MLRNNRLKAGLNGNGTAVARVKSEKLVQKTEDEKELDSLLPNICSTAAVQNRELGIHVVVHAASSFLGDKKISTERL